MTRLRQVALVARHLAPVASALEQRLGLSEPYHDPGVGAFGLENAVYAAGDTFIEVVAPVEADTTAGRYLDKRGGDGGYMAIFQLDDLTKARKRIADLGIRVVWQSDLPDIAGTHLHPKDVPGAIVSLDWADPPESWHWAGPAWTGRAAAKRGGGIAAITVTGGDAATTAQRWAEVLDEPNRRDGASGDQIIDLDDGRQQLRFASGPGEPAITGVRLYGAKSNAAGAGATTICGVDFDTATEDTR